MLEEVLVASDEGPLQVAEAAGPHQAGSSLCRVRMRLVGVVFWVSSLVGRRRRPRRRDHCCVGLGRQKT